MQISFTAPLWVWQSAKPDAKAGSWHFITVPADEAGLIRMAVPRTGGFGSVRVKVSIGETRWSTSIFPDSKTGTYLLPVKAEVRKREGLAVGETAEVTLSIDV
jgi:Domain of unknown function (DUF1905)